MIGFNYFAALVYSLLIILLCFHDVVGFHPRIGRLAVDYGPRTIGIAQGNYLGVVQPYGTIPNKGSLSNVARNILNLARTFSVSEIIVGVPLDSDGSLRHDVRNFNGRLCLNFSSVLSAVSENDFPGKFRTMLFDERYTTKEATLRLQTGKVKGMRCNIEMQLIPVVTYCTVFLSLLAASLDAMSAACLLERYIEDCGEGSMPAIPCAYPVPPELDCFDYGTVKRYVRSLYVEKDRGNPRRSR